MKDIYLSMRLSEQQIQTLAHDFTEWQDQRGVRTRHRLKQKSYTYVKLNSGLSPVLAFSLRFPSGLSERLGKTLS